MKIAVHRWPKNTDRQCSFSLDLLDGSFFADFNMDSSGHVYLERFSIGEHNCRSTDGNATKMSKDDSQFFVTSIESQDFNNDRFLVLLLDYFNANSDYVWGDMKEIESEKTFVHRWPENSARSSDFSLAIKGGSVFADFNVDSLGSVYLKGISFDGYGYCGTDGNATKMSKDDSRFFVESIKNEDVNNDRFRGLLFQYFNANKNCIWEDALIEHELLRP